MGAIHEGHLSLVRESIKSSTVTIVSVFVNPFQFSPEEDFESYPRALKQDLEKLAKEKTDIVFLPEKQSMYDENYNTYIIIPSISKNYCGISRPHFFQGVLTIVIKLLHIIKPHKAFFGKKRLSTIFFSEKNV